MKKFSKLSEQYREEGRFKPTIPRIVKSKGVGPRPQVDSVVAKLKEDLRNWFDPNHPKGGWKRINSKGEAIGPCAREPGEAKPKCMSNEKRAKLSQKERASAVRAKRKHDSDPDRKGKPINVSNFGKGKLSEDMEQLDEKNVPTSPEKWAQAKAQAKAKFDVYPSAYANGWAAKKYKEMGGGWKSVNEETDTSEKTEMAQTQLHFIKYAAEEILEYIEMGGEIEEWYQNKLSKVQSEVESLHSYVEGESRRTGMKEEVEDSHKKILDKAKTAVPRKPKDEYDRKVVSYLKKKHMKEEDEVELQEGRPSQRHPLEGHEYHKKTNAELEYIAKDAHKAAEAMKGHNTTAENKYRDQANDSATVRYFRKKSGTPDWYKKKYGLKEEVELDEAKDLEHHRTELKKTSDKIDNIVKSGGRVGLNDPLSVKLKNHVAAIKKLKEEVEQLDEISDKALKDYRYQAHSQIQHHKFGGGKDKPDAAKIVAKREAGNAAAVKRLVARSDAERKSQAPRPIPKLGSYKPLGGRDEVSGRSYSEEVVVEAEKPPFSGPYKKTPGTVTDKSGAKHGPMSRVRDLARAAMKRQADKMKPVKESLDESRKAEIVKEIMKKKKSETKNADGFNPDPTLSSEIVKT